MYHFSPTEPTRHVDKTRQDRLPLAERQRFIDWQARHGNPWFTILKAMRASVARQRPRIAAGRYDLRHLNAFIRDSAVVSG